MHRVLVVTHAPMIPPWGISVQAWTADIADSEWAGTLSLMEHGGPSRTAWGAAGHRAAHQVLEDGRIFRDPFALTILGADAEGVVANARALPRRTPMRIFIAVRHRVAEDALAHHVADRYPSGGRARCRPRHLRLPEPVRGQWCSRVRDRPSGDAAVEARHPGANGHTGARLRHLRAGRLRDRRPCHPDDGGRGRPRGADVLPLARRRAVPHPRGRRRHAPGRGPGAWCRRRVRLSQPGRPALRPRTGGPRGAR